MRKRSFYIYFLYLLVPCLLGAQDLSAPFPLGPVLTEAVYGDGRWRPDWPREIAPDAFMVKGAMGVTVELDGTSQAPNNPEPLLSRYLLAWDSVGRLSAFPMALPLRTTGEDAPALVFTQVELRRSEEGDILELSIRVPSLPAEVVLTEEVPEDRENAGTGTPEETLWSVLLSASPVKVQCGEAIFYVLFSEGGGWIAETWYDPWGNFAAYFKTRLGPGDAPAGARRVLGLEGEAYNRVYRYESGGNLSECSGDQGYFSALYNAGGRPLYWISRRSYGLQWDEEGRLVDMRDLDPVSGSGEPAAFRYEYEFDSRGNWIRRREIPLFLRGNLLLPESMGETVRQIEYAEEG